MSFCKIHHLLVLVLCNIDFFIANCTPKFNGLECYLFVFMSYSVLHCSCCKTRQSIFHVRLHKFIVNRHDFNKTFKSYSSNFRVFVYTTSANSLHNVISLTFNLEVIFNESK
eukprot:NODE_23_length_42016_cov_0.755803.p35 type:complete len:112 gc:universal NODE_23_length_42016_cov_0.755803:7098-7433(+)